MSHDDDSSWFSTILSWLSPAPPASAPARVASPHVNAPPVGAPPGTRPLPQKIGNLPEVSAWAVELVHSPAQYPMFSTATKQFGDRTVLARVEQHTWTHRNGKLVKNLNPPIRGITLYEVVSPESAMGADFGADFGGNFGGDQGFGFHPIMGGDPGHSPDYTATMKKGLVKR